MKELIITYQDCIQFYEYFYAKIAGQQEYSFIPRKQERICIESFVKRVSNLFGKESLFNYLLFAFSKYEGLDTNQGKNNIKAMWIFGQKTFKSYEERDHEKCSYWTSMMMDNYRIKKSDLISEESLSINFKELDQRERKRFNNLERQFLHCLENELYDRNSVDCILCQSRIRCIDESRD